MGQQQPKIVDSITCNAMFFLSESNQIVAIRSNTLAKVDHDCCVPAADIR